MKCAWAPLLLAVALVQFAVQSPVVASPSLSEQEIQQRVESLLSSMTIEEKVGQMTQVGMAALQHPDDVQKFALGSMLGGGNDSPQDPTAKGWVKACDEFQSWALKSRLKIPLIFGIDAVHGHNHLANAVIFPHNIGLGATRNPRLVEAAAHITALEVRASGIPWTFAPCVAVVQNERWGRTYESFGETPEIVAPLGEAAIRGFQGKHLYDSGSVLACAKHFIGDGGTTDGIDQGNSVWDEATLRRVFLPPYVAAIKAGVGSIMVSYSSWNGLKMHANKQLLTGLLKGELGFKGFLVSDWAAIDQISPDYTNDVKTSINAGVDMVMIPAGPGETNNYVEFISILKQLAASGEVPVARIDDAVRRILGVKYQMGLFEHPYAETNLLAKIGSEEHRLVGRECVRASVVLLKNEDRALPLSKNSEKLHHVTVAGRAANDMGIQCGGWTIDWQGKPGKVTTGGSTIYEGIRAVASHETEVSYSGDGTTLQGSDPVIVVVGEKPYAEMKGDRSDLSLAPEDLELIHRARLTGARVITIIISGRPLILGSALDDSDAILAAWLPGTEGEGVADVLFGRKPVGKLPRTWPRNMQQVAEGPNAKDPLFPCGFGLSY